MSRVCQKAVQGHGGACVCAPPSDKVNVRPNIPTTRCGRHPPSSTARTRRKYLRFRPWNVAAYSPSWAPRSLSGPEISHALSAAGVRTNLRRSRTRGLLCSRRSHWRGSGQTPLAGCVCQSSRPRLASAPCIAQPVPRSRPASRSTRNSRAAARLPCISPRPRHRSTTLGCSHAADRIRSASRSRASKRCSSPRKPVTPSAWPSQASSGHARSVALGTE
jgi:hypothetical protein